MAITRPEAIGAASGTDRSESGGRRPENFVDSRGMGFSPGEESSSAALRQRRSRRSRLPDRSSRKRTSWSAWHDRGLGDARLAVGPSKDGAPPDGQIWLGVYRRRFNLRLDGNSAPKAATTTRSSTAPAETRRDQRCLNENRDRPVSVIVENPPANVNREPRDDSKMAGFAANLGALSTQPIASSIGVKPRNASGAAQVSTIPAGLSIRTAEERSPTFRSKPESSRSMRRPQLTRNNGEPRARSATAPDAISRANACPGANDRCLRESRRRAGEGSERVSSFGTDDVRLRALLAIASVGRAVTSIQKWSEPPRGLAPFSGTSPGRSPEATPVDTGYACN